ncbi:MAG: carbohydrate porin [Verrucomicrobiota bacterium]
MPQGSHTHTYLFHFVFTQFLNERLLVTAGKLDTTGGDSNSFAHGKGDERFMNLGFSFNPLTLLTSPYSTLGANLTYLLGPKSLLSLSVIDGDGAIDCAGFDTLFEGRTTSSTELKLESNFFEKKGHHNFLRLYGSEEYRAFNQDPRIFVPALDLAPAEENSTWACAYDFDQYLVTESADPSQGWGIFGRFGIADKRTNFARSFYSAGLGGTGIFPGRDRDRFGVDYYYLSLTGDRLGLLTDDNEQSIDIFYNAAITPWFEVTADLQVINGAIGELEDAVVGDLRAHRILMKRGQGNPPLAARRRSSPTIVPKNIPNEL